MVDYTLAPWYQENIDLFKAYDALWDARWEKLQEERKRIEAMDIEPDIVLTELEEAEIRHLDDTGK